MFRDEWESEEELWRFFDTISDAEELHLYADGFNWDTGVEEMRRVIRHPLCDRGTARLIYWRGAPGYYARFSDRSETRNPDQADHYDLLREIEQKISAGHFRTHRFVYDPKSDRGHDMTTQYSTGPQKRPIPTEMFA
jgi:hypothetical protein